MYLIPEIQENCVRIVGFDPGTAHLGCAILDWEWDTDLPVVKYAHTINVGNSNNPTDLANIRGKRDERMLGIEEELREFLPMASPTIAITESPFCQRGKLSAYESGVEIQRMLRDCLWDYSPRIPLNKINPITLKHHVGVASKGTDKEDVKVAVMKLYGKSTDIDLSLLDEHSIDAIGAANFAFRALLNGLPAIYKKPPKPANAKPRRRRRRKAKK